MVLMSSMMLALTGVKLYSPNLFPIVAKDGVDSTNGVICCRKKNVQGYVVTFGAINL